MSYRITLSAVRAVVGEPLNMANADERIPGIVNQACERLLYGDEKGASAKWPGTYGKYRCYPESGCITWPREFETIERYAINGSPGVIRNEWYEFLACGPGVLDSCCGSGWFSGSALIDDGEMPIFDDVLGTGKKLEVFSTVDEAEGARILLRYQNDSGQRVRTQAALDLSLPLVLSYMEGEYITLPAGNNYALATSFVMPNGGPYQVIKPITNGIIRLYEYDTVNNVHKPLGIYEPNETIPIYRRSRIPGLNTSTSTPACSRPSITVVAKFRFIPAVSDNDFVQIPSMSAIKLGCLAVMKEEKNLIDDAAKYWLMAYRVLQQQTAHYIGVGTEAPINFRCGSSWGGAIRSIR